ncbi:MAG: ABC transporter ATP-binding protein, partial [Duncaniella sp.]|nr:ABC transporter ATP-binding protein [Duncaniella sp.]
SDLTREINPRGIYEELCREFRRYVRDEDYASVLKIYNRKTMISESHVARLCGLKKDDKDSMIRAVLDILRRDLEGAAELRKAVREVFR